MKLANGRLHGKHPWVTTENFLHDATGNPFKQLVALRANDGLDRLDRNGVVNRGGKRIGSCRFGEVEFDVEVHLERLRAPTLFAQDPDDSHHAETADFYVVSHIPHPRARSCTLRPMAMTTGGPVAAPPSWANSPGAATMAWLRSELRTTPGRLRLWSIIVLILTALTAIFGLNTLAGQRRSTAELRNDRAAMLFDAQGLHSALLQADAESANAFLAGGIEPAERRKRYEDAVAEAATRLRAVASRADDQETRVALDAIAKGLPVYAGLVESARANNRQGFPAGGAYLRAASAKLRGEIVSNVEEVEQIALARFRSRYKSLVGGASVIMLVLLGVLLALLVWLQVSLFRRTHRLLNIPLVAGSVVLVLVTMATIAALGTQRKDARAAVREGFRPALDAADARVQGFTAKANESLALVARGNDDAYRVGYANAITQATNRVTDLVAPRGSDPTLAREALAVFAGLHDGITKEADAGNYATAVRAAIADGQGTANAAFTMFDRETTQIVNVAYTRFLERMTDATGRINALRWILPIGVILAGALALAGLQLRINEYR
jgi:hypothetical protein